MLMTPRSTRGEGVASGKNNLEYQWMIRMSSGMARSRAEFMGKRILGYRSREDEVAGGSPK